MAARKNPRKEPKDAFVMMRLTQRERERIQEVAAREKLDTSTWMRQVILKAIDAMERR
ncbi:MAG TPA: hypothetical protein VNZ26_24955 [Vicinamibacterales bacterium]|jgi:hypothetical protein|nr:hypothetical protein [Vicinamibacterales bacterium]